MYIYTYLYIRTTTNNVVKYSMIHNRYSAMRCDAMRCIKSIKGNYSVLYLQCIAANMIMKCGRGLGESVQQTSACMQGSIMRIYNDADDDNHDDDDDDGGDDDQETKNA